IVAYSSASLASWEETLLIRSQSTPPFSFGYPQLLVIAPRCLTLKAMLPVLKAWSATLRVRRGKWIFFLRIRRKPIFARLVPMSGFGSLLRWGLQPFSAASSCVRHEKRTDGKQGKALE